MKREVVLATVLDLSEQFQQHLGQTKLGRKLTRAATGSNSGAYKQLEWRSRNINSHVDATVTIPGDPKAGWPARRWISAAVLATDVHALASLREANGVQTAKEAVAYVYNDVVHVGALAVEGALFFAPWGAEQLTVGMRRGPSDSEVAMGIWIPGERTFVAAPQTTLVQEDARIATFTSDHPGTLLV